MIAIRKAYINGTLNKKWWPKNLIAGVVVGVVALPLAMAFAIASGVAPEAGIYTSIVAGLLVSLFGGSQVQIAGPTGAFVVLLSSIIAQYGIDGLQIATIMAGIMLILMSVAKLGAVIRFIPAPVIVGFTAGIGVTIWVGQWAYFFGFPMPTGVNMFHEKLWALLNSFPLMDLPTFAIGFGSLALILLLPKVPYIKVIPSPLLAMIAATVVQSIYQFESVNTIGTAFGGIPQGLPAFTMPAITTERVVGLIGPAFTIAMLGAIESLLSAVVADGMADQRHDSNQELMGQGLANVVVPFFGGIAATGAIARTATNIRQGGRTPIAGITHAIVLAGILVFLAPLAMHIPLAAMAAILFVVAYNMSDVKRFITMVQVSPLADSLILLLTFVLTVFADLVVAVNVGVILSILQFMRKTVENIDVHEVSDEELSDEVKEEIHLHEDIMVYTVDGPLFFGAINAFESALAHINRDPKFLIIRFHSAPFVDMTGLRVLNEVIRKLQERGVEVFVSEANPTIRRHMYRAGLHRTLGRHHLWRSFEHALHKAEHMIELEEEHKAHLNEDE